MLTVWEITLVQIIDPEIITELEDIQIKKIAESTSDFTQENIDHKIEVIRKNTTAFSWLVSASVEDLLLGFILSLIGGLIIRKKRDPFK